MDKTEKALLIQGKNAIQCLSSNQSVGKIIKIILNLACYVTSRSRTIGKRRDRIGLLNPIKKPVLNYLIGEITIQDSINSTLKDKPEFKSYRLLVKKHVDNLNRKPNRKTSKSSPIMKDQNVNVASMLISLPTYPKAYSQHISVDPRLKEVQKSQKENSQVTQHLAEITAKHAQLVIDTPFDDYTEITNWRI